MATPFPGWSSTQPSELLGISTRSLCHYPVDGCALFSIRVSDCLNWYGLYLLPAEMPADQKPWNDRVYHWGMGVVGDGGGDGVVGVGVWVRVGGGWRVGGCGVGGCVGRWGWVGGGRGGRWVWGGGSGSTPSHSFPKICFLNTTIVERIAWVCFWAMFSWCNSDGVCKHSPGRFVRRRSWTFGRKVNYIV